MLHVVLSHSYLTIYLSVFVFFLFCFFILFDTVVVVVAVVPFRLFSLSKSFKPTNERTRSPRRNTKKKDDTTDTNNTRTNKKAGEFYSISRCQFCFVFFSSFTVMCMCSKVKLSWFYDADGSSLVCFAAWWTRRRVLNNKPWLLFSSCPTSANDRWTDALFFKKNQIKLDWNMAAASIRTIPDPL